MHVIVVLTMMFSLLLFLVYFHILFYNASSSILYNMYINIYIMNCTACLCLVETRPECTEDPECPDSQACINQRCIDPCIVQNPCARDATCTTRVHHPVCTCAEGYGGDPYTQCYRRT